MRLNDRIGLRLVAGAGLIALVGCAGGGGSNSPAAPSAPSTPSLVQQPQDQTRTAGQAATFTVAATANGILSYQWQKDGVDLAGATSATYTTPALTGALAGAYACKVTNALGGTQVSILSSAAHLVVNTPPAIVTQPASNPAITQGGSVSFSVAATGNGTLSYQWQKNGSGIPASSNASAATATLTLTNLTAADAGTYTCLITATLNGTTTTTSAPAVLGVGQLPTITTQPQASQTVVQGAPAAFTVAATPTSGGTLSYQWRRNGVDLPAASNASAATATLILAAATGADAGTYSCAVTNTVNGTAGVLASSNAVLAVNVPPVVAPIANQTGGEGGSVTFAASATGNGTLSYQWQKNGVDLPGATSATLTLANLQVSAADTYTCVVTNTLNGTVTSTTATASLAVNAGPTVAALAGQTVAEGAPASFTATASGLGTLAYQWRRNGTVLDATANPSAATATLTLAAVGAAEDQAVYSCLVTDTVNGVTASTASNGATLSVAKLPVFTTDVASQGYTLAAGTATFTAAATGNGALAYQWYQGAPGSGTLLAGQTAPTLALSGLASGDNGTTYFCVATNTLNGVSASAPSSVGTLVLNAAPTISAQPAAATVLLGGTATFSVTASGTGTLSYQWFKGGVAIAGATSASYTTPATVKADAGASYTCVVTNAVSGTTVSTSSAAATLAVNWAPVFDANYPTLSNPVFKEGTNANLTGGLGLPVQVTAASQPAGATISYQWYKDGVALTAGAQPSGSTIASVTGTGLTITGAKVADAGTYTCRVTNTLNGTTASATATPLVVNLILATPVITTAPVAQTVNQGSGATFSVVATHANGTLVYQWLKNGVVIYGATGASYTIPNAQASDAASYTCQLTNKDAQFASGVTNQITTTAAALTVNPVVATPVITMDPVLTANQTNLMASTQDQGNVSYLWTVTDALANNLITGVATGRTVSFNAPAAANGPVTATVTVTSNVDGTNLTGTATATVKSAAFVAPDLVVPPFAHPGDSWLKAFTTSYASETYAWSKDASSTAPSGSVTAVTPSGPIANVSIGSSATNGQTMVVAVNGQLGADSGTTKATVTVKTAGWVTKDGSASTSIGAAPTATVLPNGRVLVTGGQFFAVSSGAGTTAAAYVYDPATGRLVPTGAMNVSRTQHTATLLANGSVLVAGGYTSVQTGTGYTQTLLNSAEVWDPVTGTWSLVGSFTTARNRHLAWRIPSGVNAGKVALIGGSTSTFGGSPTTSIQIYDPATQTWSAGPNLQIARYDAQAVQLANDTYTSPGRTFIDAGKLLIVGGTGGTASNSTPSAADARWQPEIWDGTATAPAKTMGLCATPRSQHTATLLRDGNVFIAGGSATTVPTGQTYAPALTAEIFSPSTTTTLQGTFTLVSGTMLGGPMGASATGRKLHTANLLTDGTVLLAGGQNAGGANHTSTSWSVELFTPNGTTSTPTSGGTFAYSTSAANVSTYPSSLHESHYYHASAQVPAAQGGQAVIIGGQSSGQSLNHSNQVEVYTPGSGSTAPTLTVPSGLDSGRMWHTTLQVNTNQIMILGGQGTLAGSNAASTYNTTYLDTVRLYNTSTHTWTTTGNLNIPRKDAAAVLLSNGCVLVTGGKTPLNPNGDTSAELWNPAANNGAGAWTLLPSYLNVARANHSMLVLADGRVVLIGGTNINGGVKTTEIYSGGTFSSLPSSTGDLGEAKAYLNPVVPTSGPFAGQVVVAGGVVNPALSGSYVSAQVEVFNPATNTWNRNMTPLQNGRGLHSTTLLPSGKIVLIGGLTTLGTGTNGTNSGAVVAGMDMITFQPVAGTATETYDLTLNGNTGGSYQWSPGVYSQAVFTGDGHRAHASLLYTSGTNNGKILVIGGSGASVNNGTPAWNPQLGAVCEIYDPATDTFTATESLPIARKANPLTGPDTNEFSVVFLNNGGGTKTDVLVIGGNFSGNSTHIYRQP